MDQLIIVIDCLHCFRILKNKILNENFWFSKNKNLWFVLIIIWSYYRLLIRIEQLINGIVVNTISSFIQFFVVTDKKSIQSALWNIFFFFSTGFFLFELTFRDLSLGAVSYRSLWIPGQMIVEQKDSFWNWLD